MEMAEELIQKLQAEKVTLKGMVDAIEGKRKRGLKKLINETWDILVVTQKTTMFSILALIAVVLFFTGILIGLMSSNYFLIPVLSGGFFLLPFWYVIFTATSYKKQLNAELETALSIVTTSYIRSNDFILAVEENIEVLNPPVVEPFKAFLKENKLITSNVKLALEKLRERIDNDVFKEWVDQVIACQQDKSLKFTLYPIVGKLSDMRTVGLELDYLLYGPIKEFISMVSLVLGSIPLLYFLNKNWYSNIMYTSAGKATLAGIILVIFWSLAGVIRLSRPVEYKR
ncbi:hypothetical protein SAMN02746098_00177 [Desulfosporosinus lacus DSM 15449]|uniref:Tight adherence protein B n=1 Tax=Desulfosporosinus lacus DSM 15449 TaxID=1121420 RepID=A0A1M5Q971_9FIRM|nr:hypothetical protein SAMN02746098_00177 [Desulfosporosinus lacus DSM 15449]